MTAAEFLAIENAVGFYDAMRSRMPEHVARESALLYLLSKIPTLDYLAGAVMLAGELALRADLKQLES